MLSKEGKTMKKLRLLLLLSFIIITATLCAKSFDDMISKAVKLYDNGKYQEAAELADEAFKIGNPGVDHYYNTACCWALAGNKEKALKTLSQAIDAGWLDAEWMQEDRDLKILHGDARFEELVTKVQKTLDEPEQGLPIKHNSLAIIELPKPAYNSDTSIEKALKERRSIRKYKDKPLSLSEISQILWSAYGITKPIKDGPSFLRGGLKTAPSAGALYPLEIYVVAGNVTDLPAGVYKYKPDGHKLVKIADGDRRIELYKASLNQDWVKEAPASIVYSAVFSRTTEIYGKRGQERYVCMDLGHSAENIYLQAVSLNIGTVAIGAFYDTKVKVIVNMTKEEEPLYIMPIGKI